MICCKFLIKRFGELTIVRDLTDRELVCRRNVRLPMKIID